MSLDPRLWEALEAHGVTSAHLDLLLQVLEVQKNGSVAWHFIRGTLAQCDVRLTFASRVEDLQRITEFVS